MRIMLAVRSIFLSDIHLGTRACQADRLLEFLRVYVAENVFLIGDIIDFWAMQRHIVWTQAQNTFVQKILRRARRGEQVVFIPGNHDEALRDYLGISFGDIRVDLAARRIVRGEEEIHLTPIEFRLLAVLLSNHGKVLTQRQLLSQVWGPNAVEHSHYLRIYMGHLRQKLEADPARPRHLLTETGIGYRFMI